MRVLYLSISVFIAYNLSSQSCDIMPSRTNGITTCLVEQFGCDPANVSKVDDPYLYQGECSIALNRILSRAGNYQGLSSLLYPIKDQNVVKLDCENSGFCPKKYCEVLKSMADLKISFVKNAFFGASYHEHQLFSGDCWFEVGEQIVKDINYVFDCYGLPRPVIGGTSFEVFDPNNFAESIKYHNENIQRDIPSNIIEQYFKCFPEDLNKLEGGIQNNLYYFDTNGIPKDNVFFDKYRIADFNGQTPVLDIKKVECRMFLLWQALTQIDLGYNAIHMGIYWSYAKKDNGGYELLSKLTECIRSYAKNKGTFVIISGETPMQDIDNGDSAKDQNNKFIFDFDSRAMRPREINSSGDGNWPNGCNNAIDASFLELYKKSPCYMLSNLCPNIDILSSAAIVDPCTINSFGGSVGGYSASDPDCYLEQQPYSVHFDGHNIDLQNLCTQSNGPSSLTYGYSDNNWFGNLSDGCKAWWFNYFYCDRRNYHHGNGFIEIPAMLYSSYSPSKLSLITINDSPIFYNELITQTLNPKEPDMILKPIYYPLNKSCECRDSIAPNGKIYSISRVCYEIIVTNTDCSSTYSIHIKDPIGDWIPQTLGTKKVFCPKIEGTYSIGIRQDNLGLWTIKNMNFGTQSKDFKFSLDQSGIENCTLERGNCSKKFQLKVNNAQNNNEAVSIKPNPSDGIIQIINLGNKYSELCIYDTCGKLIIRKYLKETNSSLLNIDLSDFNNGTYLIKFINENEISNYKIVKI